MATINSYKDLIVWQKSLDLAVEIYKLSSLFPKEEIYVLTSQIKRAADSVSLNIAEGSTGQSNPEFGRFIGIALRSNVGRVALLTRAIDSVFRRLPGFTPHGALGGVGFNAEPPQIPSELRPPVAERPLHTYPDSG